MLKQKSLTFIFAILLLSASTLTVYAAPKTNDRREEAKLNAAKTREERRAEIEERKLEHKENIEIMKQEKLLEREDARAQREEFKEERKALRCERFATLVDKQTDRLNSNIDRVGTFKVKWETLMGKLAERGLDLPEYQQLLDDLEVLYTMLDALKAEQEEFYALFAESKKSHCVVETAGESVDLSVDAEEELIEAESLRSQLQAKRETIRIMKNELKEYYTTVIRLDIEALRIAIKESKQETGESTESEDVETSNSESEEL